MDKLNSSYSAWDKEHAHSLQEGFKWNQQSKGVTKNDFPLTPDFLRLYFSNLIATKCNPQKNELILPTTLPYEDC